MNIKHLEDKIKDKICKQIEIVPEGINRYIIHQPFHFDDGDHFVVLLKKENSGWIFTDEGHTLMHIQYDDIDLSQGTRAKILDSTLSSLFIENREGELVINVKEDEFADALFTFLQSLNKISDLDYLSKERAKSTFLEDAKSLIEELVPENRRIFNYYDEQRDTQNIYKVDFRINGIKKPNFVFFIANDSHCKNATIVCHQFEKWGVSFKATGVFEDHTEINRIAVSQFSDVAYKQIPNLSSKDRIKDYFVNEVLAA